MRKRINLSGINNYTMAQILGVNPQNFERDIIYQDLEIVNGYKPFETLDVCLETIDKKGQYNKNLLEYIDNLIISEDLTSEIEDLNVDEIDNWDESSISLFSKYTHQDFWRYRINLFREGALNIKEKVKKKKDFINWGYSDSSINMFLNSLPIEMANKAHEILIHSDYHEIRSLIFSGGNDIMSIQDYRELIFTEGSLLNKLFNIKNEGSGKAEVLVAFLFPSRVIGIGDSYDIEMLIKILLEIKVPNKSSFRFGTKGSINNFTFFSNILESIKVLRHLIKQLGHNFEKMVPPEFFELSNQLLQKGNFKRERAISSAVYSAEINAERMHLIQLWFYLAHSLTYNFDFNSNPIDFDIFSKEYRMRNEFREDLSNLINVLWSLEYVREPWKLKEDIKQEIKNCFKGIDYLICFNEKDKEINIYTSADDLVVDSISQNGIKIIEKKYKKKENTSLEDAFRKWNEIKDKSSINFYDIYLETTIGQEVNCEDLVTIEE